MGVNCFFREGGGERGMAMMGDEKEGEIYLGFLVRFLSEVS